MVVLGDGSAMEAIHEFGVRPTGNANELVKVGFDNGRICESVASAERAAPTWE